jgi:RimJ/RimL family protein N-acetyltransferase
VLGFGRTGQVDPILPFISARREMPVRLERFSDQDSIAVSELVYRILIEEFGFSESEAEQPDLADLSAHYGDGLSNFWVAKDGNEIVGTVGFVDLRNGQSLLRKMFVRLDHRGSGVADRLLERVLDWAFAHRFSSIYLGTNSKFQAAQKFYLKNGFSPVSIDSLPATVPRLELRDRFFSRQLHARR